MFDKAIIHGKIWIEDQFTISNIYINNDKIVDISHEVKDAKEIVNAKNQLVIPGLIDPHVHFNLDLGRIHSKDGFTSGSRQAAYGGMVVYIDFLDPVDNPEDLEKAYLKRKSQVDKSYCDYFFHATIKNPQCDLEDFVKKMLSLNIHSLKLFTTYSNSNRRTYDHQIIELLKLSKKYGFLLLAHIEDDSIINMEEDYQYSDLLKSRPSISEENEALKLASYVDQYGGYLYMVHLSSGKTLDKLKTKFAHILNRNFFIESCPHYFTFTHDDLLGEDGYLYTLAPPLRTKEEQKLLKKLINNVYTIGTDHCAFNIEDKKKNHLKEIPLGIGGIEHSFDIMYHLFNEDSINKMSKNISILYDKLKFYGQIKVGNFANLFIYQIGDASIQNHHGETNYDLYLGKKSNGFLTHLLLRGQWVIKNKVLLDAIGKEL